jgi:ADP-L-glycero-D-manno-heptose 6-epimerase
MNVLVTGSEGFIGKNMIPWLQGQGWQASGWEWNPDDFPNVSLYDQVLHLGAIADMTEMDVDKILKQNLEFSQRLFNECNREGVNLQYASSSSVYGDTTNFSEDAPCLPQTPYAWSKFLFDRWVFQQKQNIIVQGFRYFNVYGPYMHLRGRRANAIHKWRTQARTQGKISVWETAGQVDRDWTFVKDICQLHVDFINNVKCSGIWNVGSGINHSFLDIAKKIAEQEGAGLEFVPVPAEEKLRMRHTTQADLTLLNATIGQRKWFNVFDFLEQS